MPALVEDNRFVMSNMISDTIITMRYDTPKNCAEKLTSIDSLVNRTEPTGE